MKRFYVENILASNKILGDEFNHLKKVLRCEVGEKIICLSGDGNEYVSEITRISNDSAEVKILEVKRCNSDPKIDVTVFMGLPKGDKFEFLIQKLSELGASTIIPFESSFTIAKPKDKKLDRYKKIALEACKQCGRSKPLEVKDCITFKNLLQSLNIYERCYFAYENAETGNFDDAKNFKKICVIIGAEGGFSEEEANSLKLAGAKEVSLGKRILRCETAPLYAMSVINYITNN